MFNIFNIFEEQIYKICFNIIHDDFYFDKNQDEVEILSTLKNIREKYPFEKISIKFVNNHYECSYIKIKCNKKDIDAILLEFVFQLKSVIKFRELKY